MLKGFHELFEYINIILVNIVSDKLQGTIYCLNLNILHDSIIYKHNMFPNLF